MRRKQQQAKHVNCRCSILPVGETMQCMCGDSILDHDDEGRCTLCPCFKYRPSTSDDQITIERINEMKQEQRRILSVKLFDEYCESIVALHEIPTQQAQDDYDRRARALAGVDSPAFYIEQERTQ